MRELSDFEQTAVSGGDGSGFSFDIGTVPGFGLDEGDTPWGFRGDYSFGNGWSLVGGSTPSGSDFGVEIRFVWR